MCGHVAVCILRVLDAGVDVLCHAPAQGHGHGLYAAADAEDGHLTVGGQTGEQQFGQVALGVDAAQAGLRLLALEERVQVGAAGEQQAVNAVEGAQQHRRIGTGGDEQGRAAGGDDLLVVALGHFRRQLAIVGADADDGTAAAGPKAVIEAGALSCKVELVHSASVSLNSTGISRLMFCSNEMSVSVATTPGISCSWPFSRCISCSLSRA